MNAAGWCAVLTIAVLLLIGVLGASCTPAPTMTMDPKPSGRFRVERVGVFEDNLAYHGKRGVYVIRDEATGREYLGISGVGISETGVHGGRSHQADER